MLRDAVAQTFNGLFTATALLHRKQIFTVFSVLKSYGCQSDRVRGRSGRIMCTHRVVLATFVFLLCLFSALVRTAGCLSLSPSFVLAKALHVGFFLLLFSSYSYSASFVFVRVKLKRLRSSRQAVKFGHVALFERFNKPGWATTSRCDMGTDLLKYFLLLFVDLSSRHSEKMFRPWLASTHHSRHHGAPTSWWAQRSRTLARQATTSEDQPLWSACNPAGGRHHFRLVNVREERSCHCGMVHNHSEGCVVGLMITFLWTSTLSIADTNWRMRRPLGVPVCSSVSCSKAWLCVSGILAQLCFILSLSLSHSFSLSFSLSLTHSLSLHPSSPLSLSLSFSLSLDLSLSLTISFTHSLSPSLSSLSLSHSLSLSLSLSPVAIACTDPGTVAQSSRQIVQNKPGFGVDSTIRYTCLSGYTRQGAETLTCLTGGQWSHPLPTCAGERQ